MITQLLSGIFEVNTASEGMLLGVEFVGTWPKEFVFEHTFDSVHFVGGAFWASGQICCQARSKPGKSLLR
eukprot:5694133-Amphidinium_carterae.1